MNEYHPWEQSGETELEYFRRLFLEESGRAETAEELLREARRHIRGGKLGYDDEREVARRIDAFLVAAPPAAPPTDKSWENLPVGPGGRCPECGSRAGLVPPHRDWCSRGKAPAAPPEPPPLPAEVQRVVEAAEEWDSCLDDRAKHYKLVHTQWRLREAVAALRASRKENR